MLCYAVVWQHMMIMMMMMIIIIIIEFFIINLLKPTGYVMHQQIYHSTTVRSAHTVFMCFVFILRTTSDLCHLQHKLIGFHNRDEKCLLRGTDWGFK